MAEYAIKDGGMAFEIKTGEIILPDAKDKNATRSFGWWAKTRTSTRRPVRAVGATEGEAVRCLVERAGMSPDSWEQPG